MAAVFLKQGYWEEVRCYNGKIVESTFGTGDLSHFAPPTDIESCYTTDTITCVQYYMF